MRSGSKSPSSSTCLKTNGEVSTPTNVSKVGSAQRYVAPTGGPSGASLHQCGYVALDYACVSI